MKLPVRDIVNEGHMVRGVPVQAVAVHVEGDGVKQVVDWSNNLQFMFYVLSLHVAVACGMSPPSSYILSILLCRTVDDSEAATNEVVLDINYYKGCLGLYNLNQMRRLICITWTGFW